MRRRSPILSESRNCEARAIRLYRHGAIAPCPQQANAARQVTLDDRRVRVAKAAALAHRDDGATRADAVQEGVGRRGL